MSQPLRFVFVLHNHQPVGNFDHVFEQAYNDGYLTFLDVFERYESLKLGLHISGPLAEWLDARHPEYFDRLSRLVAAGRLEIIGGAFYEPILAMIPSRDRVGQISSYKSWLERRFGCRVRGMWMPERVWEQNMVSDLAEAGVEYTLLDDFHFKNAGLSEDQLLGYYLTEDAGRLIAVFPDSEPLRYLIPFGTPERVIEHLGYLQSRRQGAVAVFGDDGEKLGVWPETKRSVYDEGWLTRFFDLLCSNESWIQSCTPSEVLDAIPPEGRIYLPEGSYREMTEWVLPVEQLSDYAQARRDLEHDPRWPKIARFVRGGFWRNFKTKYPETGEMYARMMMVSDRLQAAVDAGAEGETIDAARAALYRGQCNCSYWHGAFGGVYLPHLRNAIYSQLIAADTLLEQAAGHRGQPWVESQGADFNLDGRQEVRLANDQLVALLAPAAGGQLYELDARAICHNLLATLNRRPEAYHRQVLAGAGARNDIAGVAERVIFKQPNLDERLAYDTHPRKSLLDHFYDVDVTHSSVMRGEAAERGDFLSRAYEARIRRGKGRAQAQMAAIGSVGDLSVRITKSVTLEAGSSTLEIAYLLEGIPSDRTVRFAIEFNFAGLPSGADDRYYQDSGERLGQLGERLDRADVKHIGLVDEWLGIDVGLTFSQPSGLWTFPIETVSQSEGGFELVHQSIAVLPHWLVQGDADGRWSVGVSLSLDTTAAERRGHRCGAIAATL